MICDICGKKQATVHLTEIIDEQVTELHLCEECAQEKGAQMEQHFNLADLLAGLADFGAQITETEGVAVKCPSCGMAYNDFRKIGRLGCSDCYEAFKKHLIPILRRIHGSAQHLGKIPSRAPKIVVKLRDELAELKMKLERAIKLEQFEEAAELRDKIKALDKKKQ
ncbi:MAG: UvrB/UvrC motif-containing protein [Candidatus Omnitrophota bacterium]